MASTEMRKEDPLFRHTGLLLCMKPGAVSQVATVIESAHVKEGVFSKGHQGGGEWPGGDRNGPGGRLKPGMRLGTIRLPLLWSQTVVVLPSPWEEIISFSLSPPSLLPFLSTNSLFSLSFLFFHMSRGGIQRRHHIPLQALNQWPEVGHFSCSFELQASFPSESIILIILWSIPVVWWENMASSRAERGLITKLL